MKKTELESVVEFCQKMNPEIMDLKFGCKIFFTRWYKIRPARFLAFGKKGVIHSIEDHRSTADVTHGRNDLRVLGRDITMVDIRNTLRSMDLLNDEAKILLMNKWSKHGLHEQDTSLINWLFIKLKL